MIRLTCRRGRITPEKVVTSDKYDNILTMRMHDPADYLFGNLELAFSVNHRTFFTVVGLIKPKVYSSRGL